MKKVYQTDYTKTSGDCFNACVASILEIELADIPDFGKEEYVWFEKFLDWLKENYNMFAIELEMGKESEKVINMLGYHILSGDSPRFDVLHSVVGFGNQIVHDPLPHGNGELKGEKRLYMLLVPINPADAVRREG